MKKTTKLGLLLALSLSAVACFDFFSPSCVGAECNASASKNETYGATPSPTPIPPIVVDSSCTQTCAIEEIRIDNGVTVVPLGGEVTLHMSPYTKVYKCDANGKPTKDFTLVPTTSECDVPRSDKVNWTASSNAIELTPAGFEALVKRKATGAVTVTIELEGKKVQRLLN